MLRILHFKEFCFQSENLFLTPKWEDILIHESEPCLAKPI